MSTNDIISWLPEVAVYNIFLRLTVKDLSRIKSVCKSWLSLISSRNFIKTHLAKSTDDPHFTNHRLIFCNARLINHDFRPYVDYTVRSHDLILTGTPVHCLNYEEMVPKAEKLYNPTKDIDNWTYVVGCCNGLVCLACFDGSVLLWNPTTRKSTRLPEYEHAHTVFGFGYDESKDDYKVFTIIGKSDYKVSVYSSNSDCWRMIGDFPFGKLSFKTSRGQFAHGALHWLVSETDLQKDGTTIYSLDMNTETQHEVLQPNFGKDEYDLTLGTFGNSLSVFCQYKCGVDIWVVKEYGVQQSWTKLFTFPLPPTLSYTPRIRPICKFVNGNAMLLFNLSLILNSPNNEIRMLFDWWDNPLYNVFQEHNVYTYVESLVSPPNLNCGGPSFTPDLNQLQPTTENGPSNIRFGFILTSDY